MTNFTRPETRQANNPDGGRSSNGGNGGHIAGLNDWEYAKTLAAAPSASRDGNMMPITIPTNFNNGRPADDAYVCAGDYRRSSSADYSTADETSETTRRLSRDTLASEASYLDLSSSSPRGSYSDGFGGGGADGDLMSMLAAHQLQGGITLDMNNMGGDGGQGQNPMQTPMRNPMMGGGMLFGSGPGDLNLSGLRRSAPPNSGLRGDPLVPPKPKRQRNKQTFAMKLWNLLENPSECGGALRWMPNGAAFCVVDPDELVKRVLPSYFKEAKYTSFVSCRAVRDVELGTSRRSYQILPHLSFFLPRKDPEAQPLGLQALHPPGRRERRLTRHGRVHPPPISTGRLRDRLRDGRRPPEPDAGGSNPDLASVDFAMSMAPNGGRGVGMVNASFHSSGSLGALANDGGRGLPVHPPRLHQSLPGPPVHAHRQPSINDAVSAAQEMSLELQLQDTNRMLMQLNELQNQYASSTGQQRQQQAQSPGGGGRREQERRWEQMMRQQEADAARGAASDPAAEAKIDFSSIDAGAMNSNSTADMQQETPADGAAAAPGRKKPSRDDPDAVAAFMGLRRTSLGYMPYLPTSSRRGSNNSSVSDSSNKLGDPFAEFPDHSCPVTNPVDDMRDARFHSGSSTPSQQQRGVSQAPSPPLSMASPVLNATTPGDTFEVDIIGTGEKRVWEGGVRRELDEPILVQRRQRSGRHGEREGRCRVNLRRA
ncbi:hypothetical protein THAOC_16949 [Thalassiosira oceanica]|uniref:HSF-type DNA-binding domain-containing protein n=1 Tax=Thalassiosira oceanica TaxID=159749 RepID=K0S8F1_THAOC|nr:hypothetical protein THAOC_16949 [Thalassiosira oceanica]|eukprot:EJK62443.1 hypothetical protein THAOC_16949 [Thalassiosira oceanica]